MPYGRAAYHDKARPPVSLVPILQSWRLNTAAAGSLRSHAHHKKGPATTQAQSIEARMLFLREPGSMQR